MEQAFDIIRPWLVGNVNAAGEIRMHCPMHEDLVASASYNPSKGGVWHCKVCDKGGSEARLIDFILTTEAEPPSNGSGPRIRPSSNGGASYVGDLNDAMVAGWHSALMANDPALQEFIDQRGIERTTLQDRMLGWDHGFQAYTIPVYEIDGSLVNCRFYRLNSRDDRGKIWSIAGRGQPVLYPANELTTMSDVVIICEGELDSIVTEQNSQFPTFTRTGAAKVWSADWNEYFRGKVVYVCHDADEAGEYGNALVTKALNGIAREVYVIHLPYEVTEKHGKDLTDWWLEGHTKQDFIELMFGAELVGEAKPLETVELIDISLVESFDATKSGQTMRTRVTVTGKHTPTFIVPEVILYTCNMDAGTKCTFCPMNSDGYNGNHTLTLARSDPDILKWLGATDKAAQELMRIKVGAQKCGRLTITPTTNMSVEELWVRPSVEQYRINETAGDYVYRKVVSVGRHDTMPNSTVEVVGTIYPSPKTQHNEFQAWQVEQTQTGVDRLEMTPEVISLLENFQCRNGLSPLGKIMTIAADQAEHVTQIYGRDEMHALMDLTFHSVLAFTFDGKVEPRGWLDVLVIGDTRTGKTEAAKRLIQWNGAGEYVSGEAASFAGVVGGLQQLGDKRWTITWGAVPINDRRLVVLDEVSGLTVDQISQMSSIRSSGEAQLTKIQSERTYARTRLIWEGNPRDGKTMDSFARGCQAIQPLIGNNEDIARFDLAMSVADREVSSEEINRPREAGTQRYTMEMCRTSVQWAWSRKLEHVRWEHGAEQLVYDLAINMGNEYAGVPPLVQSANVRQKIARIAVAMATRLFSTDGTYQNVVVTKLHVKAAVDFMNMLYSMQGFGYAKHSRDRIASENLAVQNQEVAAQYLADLPKMAQFLRERNEFHKKELAEIINIGEYEANTHLSQLWEWKLVTLHEKAIVRVTPALHEILRGLEGE